MATDAPVVTWECPKCGMLNYDHQLRCIICAAMQRKPQAAPSPVPNVWECVNCGMLNYPQQGLCIACSAPQPTELDMPHPNIAPVLLPPPEPDFYLLLELPPDLPDLDVLVSDPLDALRAARRAATRRLVMQILGDDPERAERFLDGAESVSVHDVLRRAPRYGELLAAQRRWVKGAEHPLYVVDTARDLTTYVTAASQGGATPLEGVIVKAELYHECSDGQPVHLLYLDYEFPAPQTRKRIDGVALIPFDAPPTPQTLPAPGMRALVGFVSDKLHDLL
ncbi:MAG: zinc finger Ran-binding domain-containing protein [Chloroflexota bacterium]|nr:zinc finger Ran-binding domain-containing protein [Chloroflexota bacterium]